MSDINMLCFIPKKPTAQMAHLVFANTQSQRSKNQKSHFFPTLNGMLKSFKTNFQIIKRD